MPGQEDTAVSPLFTPTQPISPQVTTRVGRLVYVGEPEDLIEFPEENERNAQTNHRDKKPVARTGPATCNCKPAARQTKGLADSKWASPSFRSLGHFPRNTALLGHAVGCPVRVQFEMAHPLDCGANPAAYHGLKNASTPGFRMNVYGYDA
ncbi:unnamed protein product [Parascedosporium putredinis]|uniref:Uncharacterized protein n=1 Tax=Parascedosporium putredinis TaxID=1442378 RepID=A0A9P1H8I4_9PEZI|nr:unnamed protein product [Parascedosporium putredinis]CAI8002426.1 unnamed protein product [Parascedosporium putredinis]